MYGKVAVLLETGDKCWNLKQKLINMKFEGAGVVYGVGDVSFNKTKLDDLDDVPEPDIKKKDFLGAMCYFLKPGMTYIILLIYIYFF
jgi:hypothetical protein